MIDTSKKENCNKKILQNDAGPSQNKSYDRYETQSLDECVKNTINGLRAIPKHMNNDKGGKKPLNAQLNIEKISPPNI